MVKALKRNGLVEPAPKTHGLDTLTYAILLFNCYKAEADSRTSDCNVDERLPYMLQRGYRKTTVNIAALEHCLWACNMLDEMGEFWHPLGLSFEEFTKKLLTDNYEFDTIYNTLERKKRGIKNTNRK